MGVWKVSSEPRTQNTVALVSESLPREASSCGRNCRGRECVRGSAPELGARGS